MKKLAVQMYTVRDFTKTAKGLAETLKKCADMGYTAVQMSAVGALWGENAEVTAAEARQMLDDNGLKCIATHRALPVLMDETEKEIELHQVLGCDYAAIGGIPAETYADTADGYRRFIAEIAPMVAKLKAAGIRFGHHNHAREFLKVLPDSTRLEDILIDEGGADLMLELDLYWVEHAGTNCVRILERSQGRVPVIHLKDKEVVAGDGPVMCPIGEGNMDWNHIIPACKMAGVCWYAVEQDVCRRDAFDCLRSSFDYLSGFGL